MGKGIHTQCKCKFWVTRQEKYCPNCGVYEPQRKAMKKWATDDYIGLSFVFLLPIASLIGISYLTNAWQLGGLIALIALFFSIIASIVIPMFINEWLFATNSSLRKDERMISQRLREIETREQQILSVEKVVKAESVREEKMLDALEKAKSLLDDQRQRYEVKQWMIELLRWQNKLEPLAANLEGLSLQECNRRLANLQEIFNEGVDIVAKFSIPPGSDLPRRQVTVRGGRIHFDFLIHPNSDLPATPDGLIVLERFRECLANCEVLRQSLIAQQTLIAVKGIEQGKEILALTDTNLHSLELFNARADVGQFSNSLMELEEEYARLEFQEEAARQLKLLQKTM